PSAPARAACPHPYRRRRHGETTQKYTPTFARRFVHTCYSKRTRMTSTRSLGRPDSAAEICFAGAPGHRNRREDDTMDERDIHALINEVRAGRLSRRRFVQTMVGLGLTAPLAAQMLTAGGVAAQPKASSFNPTRRGGGGPLRVLWWQAPTLLNPHFATGTKDQDGSRIFYEPLAAYDPEGNLVPVLAADIPTVDNGGLGRDGTWVIW